MPLTAAHAEALYPLLADEATWRYGDDRGPDSLEALRERFARLETRLSGDGSPWWLNWAVDADDIGTAGFVQATVFAERREADIAYVIGRSYWSRGIGTKAVRAMLEFLASALGVTRAAATIDQRNTASIRLATKLEFALVDENDPRNLRFERELRAGL